ncbi:hypothetical protein STIAU_3282 [Stigmatella aurantiaca DW4/3-1]|uniref:Uncharacterized protein n=1 Tax=Stigmatella aurantiaca (strain DW4/3-1) TaxID=378806 RepID=Q099R5_STIAD|nr:hypothetical protein STIAU_3282 [Stigmatella aurantiaca DW4/3-1]
MAERLHLVRSPLANLALVLGLRRRAELAARR